MDVTPMSLQMVVPRATEASQVQHNLNQAANLQQEFETMRQEADAKRKESQVRGKARAVPAVASAASSRSRRRTMRLPMR